jgi:hypothetical protein
MNFSSLQGIAHLIKTTDSLGQLMPSLLWTDTSDEAKDMGLVEDCLVEVYGKSVRWQKLTEKGNRIKLGN